MIKTKKQKQITISDSSKNYAHNNVILDRWTEPQIRMLQRVYLKAKTTQEGLDFYSFLKVFPLLEHFPGEIQQTAFKAFLPTRLNIITFRDFCLTLSQIIHSSHDDQAAFLFRIFDLDLDQALNHSEFQTLVTTCGPYIRSEALPRLEENLHMDATAFKTWAQTNLSVDEVLECFQIVPTPNEERKTIQETMKNVQEMEPGEKVFLLNAKWWEAWMAYVRFHEAGVMEGKLSRRSTSTIVGDRPVDIENEGLLESGNTCVLRRGLREGQDFLVLPESVWDALSTWYGGGPSIKRTVILHQGEKKVDLYPPIVKVALYFKKSNKREAVSIVLSSSFSAAETQAAILIDLGVKDIESVRFWLKIGSEWKQLHNFENPDLSGKEVIVEVAEFVSGRHYWPMDQRLALEGNWREFKVGTRVDVQRAPNLWVEAMVISSTNTHVKVKLLRDNQYEEFPKTSEDLSAPGSKIATLTPLTQPSPPGAKGLVNLGNTCYISCVLQCVSNTPLLRDYLRNKKNHSSHINTNNPNGFKGAMAMEVCNVIHDLWETRRPMVSPAPFHKALSRYFPQFTGHDQHDCHELLGVLLDSLHEDLSRGSGPPSSNTITLKNPVSGQGEKQAEEQWKELQGAQGSAISDLMGGQTRTTLRCKACGDTSVLFELFMYLALPIPVSMEQALYFTFFPAVGRLVRFGLVLPKGTSLENLVNKISEVTSLEKESLLLGDIYYSRLNSYYDPTSQESLRRNGINSRTELVVYETPVTLLQYERDIIRGCKLPADCEPGDRVDVLMTDQTWVPGVITNVKSTAVSKEFYVSCYFKEMMGVWVSSKSEEIAQYRSRSRLDTDRLMRFNVLNRKATTDSNRPESIGIPFPVAIGNWQTYQDLQEILIQKLDRFIRAQSKKPSMTSPNFISQTLKIEEQGLRRVETVKKPYALKILNRGGSFCYNCGPKCTGCDFPLLKNTLANITGQNFFTIGVDWNPSTYFLDCVEDESIRAASELDKKNTAPLELLDCIDSFTKEEELESVCEACKNRGISMKLDIWRLPDILILNLKRFAYLSGAPEKIDQMVDYPLTAFDVSKWVQRLKASHGFTQSTTALQSAYDLYAVVYHSGSMEGGHYTTCCVHEIDGKTSWLLYDDEQVLEVIGDPAKTVVNRNAYLLFFRRRKLSTSNLVNLTCLS